MSRESLIAMVKATTNSPTTLGKLLHVSPQRADQLLNPDKHAARVLAKKNVKPDSCQLCKRKTDDLEWHHYNYDKPDRGIWACVGCHNLIPLSE